MRKLTKKNFYDIFHKNSSVVKRIINHRDLTYFYITDSLNFPLLKTNKNFSVLDIGCGVGNISFYLAKKYAKILALDISRKAIDVAKKSSLSLNIKNIKFVCGTINSLPDKKFDLITCIEVIEHIDNDKLFLKDINSRLKKDGYLVLSTPIDEIFLYKLGFYTDFDKRVGHLRRYKINNLSALLESNGFRILRIKKSESIIRSLFFTTKLNIFSRLFKFPLSNLLNLTDEFFGKFFGFSDVIVIAQKK